jgi:hypothetical protein
MGTLKARIKQKVDREIDLIAQPEEPHNCMDNSCIVSMRGGEFGYGYRLCLMCLRLGARTGGAATHWEAKPSEDKLYNVLHEDLQSSSLLRYLRLLAVRHRALLKRLGKPEQESEKE